ncbi:MAG: acetate--CoA ligase family protein [Candidatus Magnetomorum sp.]|nr:acetate--CoA ligase family protein [Candidatus Magnetomorum sp.]
MNKNNIQYIETVIEKAYNDGRDTLFEHEVYDILHLFGMKSPAHILIKEESQISEQVLSLFSSQKVVLKIVSRDITHKLNVGGVKVVYKDSEFIKYCFSQMKSSIEKRGVRFEGVLLVNFIDYSKEIGHEILLGFRESDAFGPMISFTKGGTDAEHFARCYSAPNLILAPIDRKWAQALLESAYIQEKYLSEGKNDYIYKIIDAGLKLSDLAVAFSNFFASDSQFIFREFEINPFIFTPDDEFVAIDGFARFERKGKEPFTPDIHPHASLLPFFEPKGIALVGVSSTDNSKPGNVILNNLIKLNHEDIFCININQGSVTISGKTFPLFKSLQDIHQPIDLVIIATPAEHSLKVVEDCAKKGAKAIVLISGGFSEVTKNVQVEEQILAVSQKYNIRIIGPNCLGIVYSGKNESPGVNTFFISEKKFRIDFDEKSNVALLTQSGALGISEIYNLKNYISPKYVISYGNQIDVDPGDMINYFSNDSSVETIGCYIEGFKRGAGRKFFNCVSQIKKPVIVYKAGRTEAGRKATESHTASIAGEYMLAKAAFKQAGAIVADSMIEHGDLIKTFALLNDFKVTGNRVAVIANAGYEKAYAADNIGDLAVASFDANTREKLKKILPSYVNIEPFLDLTPMASDEIFEQSIETVLKSNFVDALFISIAPYSEEIHTTDEEIENDQENLAARIVRLVHQHKKPTVISVNVISGGDAMYNKIDQILGAGKVPTFLSAGRAMKCLNAFIRYKMTKDTNNINEWLK